MNLSKSLMVIAAVAFLSGCAASGVKVSEEQARTFKVGKSTYPEVIQALGNPTNNTISSDGTRVVSYTYSTTSARAQNFIPYVGPFVAGYDTAASSVKFTFDHNSILRDTSSSQSNVGIGTNLAAGNPQPVSQPGETQPRTAP